MLICETIISAMDNEAKRHLDGYSRELHYRAHWLTGERGHWWMINHALQLTYEMHDNVDH